MDEFKIRDLQLIELDILKEVVRVCEFNDIEYFLDFGTAWQPVMKVLYHGMMI